MKLAMRCSQEQFDAIKDRLTICDLITNFDKSSYLINCYRESSITNLPYEYATAWADEFYDEWNEEIFLNACGIEPLNVFQFYSEILDEWLELSPDRKYRIKPDHSKEIAELERQIQELKNK